MIVMNKQQFVQSLFVALSIFFIVSCGAKHGRVSRVIVTGEANSQAQPDAATIVASVVTQSSHALDAQQQNARKSEALMNAARATLSNDRQATIKTSDYKLQPEYKYTSASFPTIKGYEARNTVTITLSDLNKVGAVIDAATQAGANSIERVAFSLRDGNSARSQTLAEASRQAMNKAEAIAKALNGRIVRVVEEREGGANVPMSASDEESDARYKSSAMSMQAAKSIPTRIEAGSLNINSQVQLVVEIETQPSQ